MTEMSNGELGRQIEGLSKLVAHGFESLNVRVDGLTEQVRQTNGRVGGLEVRAATGEQKTVNLEREVFSRRRVVASPEVSNNGDSTPITRRDLQVAVFAIAALFAAIRWLPALFTAAQGAP